jgi:hypothetical protein
MYEPVLNHVLVQIDDREAAWGGDQSADGPMGKSYNKGKLISIGDMFPFGDTARLDIEDLDAIQKIILKGYIGRPVMWHKGHEGESIFEHEGKQYAFIFWWDIVGVKPQTVQEVSDRVVEKSQSFAKSADETHPHVLEALAQEVHKRGPEPIENDDVKATRETLKVYGVPTPENVEIVGGGPENGNFTGTR